jgi:hypothetical protein
MSFCNGSACFSRQSLLVPLRSASLASVEQKVQQEGPRGSRGAGLVHAKLKVQQAVAAV